jgi:hypothetical protein
VSLGEDSSKTILQDSMDQDEDVTFGSLSRLSLVRDHPVPLEPVSLRQKFSSLPLKSRISMKTQVYEIFNQYLDHSELVEKAVIAFEEDVLNHPEFLDFFVFSKNSQEFDPFPNFISSLESLSAFGFLQMKGLLKKLLNVITKESKTFRTFHSERFSKLNIQKCKLTPSRLWKLQVMF